MRARLAQVGMLLFAAIHVECLTATKIGALGCHSQYSTDGEEGQSVGAPAGLLTLSPFLSLERMAAPVQMICGAHDIRCPASESIQARDRLQALGKVCELTLYEDEGHSFLKIENVIDAKRRQVTFLGQILGNMR